MATTKASSKSPKPTVVITGSDGLIGSALVRALHTDYDIVGLDNDRESTLDELHELIYCDLTDGESVRVAFAKLRRNHGEKIASFIHLAAYYDFSGEDSPLYEKLTVEGTHRILRALQDFDVEQFVFSSTLLVMKPSDESRIDETSPTRAEWRYPESKLETEELIEEERGGIPAVSLRIGGVYDSWGRAAPLVRQLKMIYEKDFESHFFPGDPDSGQSMVHLDDLVACFRRVIEKRGALQGFQNFLIGEPEVVSYKELQETANELIHGKERSAIPVPKPLAKAGAQAMKAVGLGDESVQPWMVDIADEEYRIDIDKAREMLDWQPRHNLRDELSRIIERLLEDPKSWYEQNGMEVPEEVAAR